MKDPEEEEWEAFKKEIAVEVAVAQDIQVWTLQNKAGVYIFMKNYFPLHLWKSCPPPQSYTFLKVFFAEFWKIIDF